MLVSPRDPVVPTETEISVFTLHVLLFNQFPLQ